MYIWENAIVFCFFGIFLIFETSRDHYLSDFYQCCILQTVVEGNASKCEL